MKEHIWVKTNSGDKYVLPLAPEVRGKLRVVVTAPVALQQLKSALYGVLLESLLEQD